MSYYSPESTRVYDELPEQAFIGIDELSTAIGFLNTEAKCTSLILTPQELVPVTDVIKSLKGFGAYDLVSNKRFKASTILSRMPDEFIEKVDDIDSLPTRRKLWVQKNNGIIGTYVSGLAGDLVNFSYDHNRPLRTIIGEKRESDGVIGSIEIRLGILASMLALSKTRISGIFTRDELQDKLDPTYKVNQSKEAGELVRRHLERLKDGKVIEDKHIGNRKYLRFATKPDGKESIEEVNDLIIILGRFVSGNEIDFANSAQKGLDLITSDRQITASLIQRSFASTGHTGKVSK